MSYIFTLGLKNTSVSANPTEPCFFCADPAIFIAFQKNKNEKIFIPPTLKCFRKLDNFFLNVRIATLMIRIIFFNFLDVLNVIIDMV